MSGFIYPPTNHLREVGRSLNQRMSFQQSTPLYWDGPPAGLPVQWSPKVINDISLKQHGNIAANYYDVAPAANSTNWLAYKRYLAVRPSNPYAQTSGRAITGLFVPTSMANNYLGRSNV